MSSFLPGKPLLAQGALALTEPSWSPCAMPLCYLKRIKSIHVQATKTLV